MSRYSGIGKASQENKTKQIRKQLSPKYSNSRAMPGRAYRTTQAASGLKVFKISDMDFLKRFLITGATGSMYFSQRNQVTEQVGFLEGLANSSVDVGIKAVCLAEEISVQGRAARNDSALLTLVILSTSKHLPVRRAAYAAIPKVARTATHLFELVSMVKEVRGIGRGLRNAINGWYLNKNPNALGYQLAKYRQRNGWSHRDVLRLTRPKRSKMSEETAALINYAVHPDDGAAMVEAAKVSPAISAYEELKNLPYTASVRQRCIDLIEQHRLPFEVLPTEWLTDPVLWSSLLKTMNPEAMMRNLSRVTRLGLFSGAQASIHKRYVRDAFSSESLARARLHPLKLLIAHRSYLSGMSKGGVTWSPDRDVAKIIEEGFYNSFQYVESSGKNVYVGLDVSGSMGIQVYPPIGVPRTLRRTGTISAYEASAVLAKAMTASEPNVHVGAFSNTMQDITRNFTLAKTLGETVRVMQNVRMGSTNLSLPMHDALANPKLRNTAFDAFIIFTDNEVNIYDIHPQKLIEEYRAKVGKNTRFIVVGMFANKISIADPNDPYMLDIGGFDAALPKLISEFIKD